MSFLLIVFYILVIILVLILGLAMIRDFFVFQSSNQKKFLKGKLPKPLPNGEYKGSVNGPRVGWQGKTFKASSKSGFNNIKSNNNDILNEIIIKERRE
jgi:hypothetical protein